MQSIAFYFYMMAVGFVLAGVLASFAQLLSGKPLGFGLEPKSIMASLAGVFLRAFAGPVIIMRNAWDGARLKMRSPAWLGVSAVIAAAWSLFSGAVLMDLISKF